MYWSDDVLLAWNEEWPMNEARQTEGMQFDNVKDQENGTELDNCGDILRDLVSSGPWVPLGANLPHFLRRSAMK